MSADAMARLRGELDAMKALKLPTHARAVVEADYLLDVLAKAGRR